MKIPYLKDYAKQKAKWCCLVFVKLVCLVRIQEKMNMKKDFYERAANP